MLDSMLSDIIDVLADPADGTPLSGADDFTRLVSESGHSFDVARQGYVTLAAGAGLRHQGDSMEMAVPDTARPVIVEIGAGTGYYLAHTLDDVDGARGVGMDISVHAARRLATCHPRVGAIVADVWERLPMRDNSIDVITVVFAPRNAAEFARVLTPEGQVVFLTADRGHLAELREPLGILDVEEGKLDRLMEQSSGHLRPVAEPELIEFPMTLDKDSISAQIGMSPSARHIEPAELDRRIAQLPETMTVTGRAHLVRMGRA